MNQVEFTSHEDEIDIPEEAAAVIFHVDGSVALALPGSMGGPATADREVPRSFLAATELLFRLEAGELSIEELADAFEARVKS